MSDISEPLRLREVLRRLAVDYRFRPTAIVRGRVWRWVSERGSPLMVNLPATIEVGFHEDSSGGMYAILNHENAFLNAAYAALLLDSAAAINAGTPVPGMSRGKPSIAFKVVQGPGDIRPRKKGG
jgi:hypothetical protein